MYVLLATVSLTCSLQNIWTPQTETNRDLKYDYMILLYPGPTEDFPRKFIRLEEPRR